MKKNKKIILTAIFIATSIVLSRFLSIRTPILTISLVFIPHMLSAIWLGPKYAIFINAISDIIGALLFPIGAYFVGYTITAALSGLIYGLLLYKKDVDSISDKKFFLRVILAVILVTVICNMGLNTYWISITYGKAFKVLFMSRLVKELVMIPIAIVTILFIERALRKPFDKYIREND